MGLTTGLRHDGGGRIGIGERVLAEAVRVHEEGRGATLHEPQADAAGRSAGGDLERRIVVRAGAVSVAHGLRQALAQLRGATIAAVVIAAAVAAVAGATAARLALGASAGEPANFFWVLGSLLGVHTLALLVWIVIICLRPGDTVTGLLGGAALALGRRLNRLLHRGPLHVAASQAAAGVFASGAVGRWLLSSISHLLWLAFLVGGLLMVVLLLSTRQYSFAWETTILSARTYVDLTRILAILPDWLGFPTPDAGQVAASRWTGIGIEVLAAREAWAGLLVGAIVAYGIVPRAMALMVAVGVWRGACRRYRLDLTQIGFARLEARVMPVAHSIGVVDQAPPTPVEDAASGPPETLPIAAEGPAAVLGLEIEPPPGGWPPVLDGARWLDLGFVDDRDDRRRVVERLTAALPPPRAVVVVCALTATPDRGTAAFVRILQAESRVPAVLALTGGHRLRERDPSAHLERRVADWRRLAARAGVPDDRVVEVDLDHLTAASGRRLATVLAFATDEAPGGRRLRQAFAHTVTQARGWTEAPGPAQQAELQRDIARLYQGERAAWRDLLHVPAELHAPRIDDLRAGAGRMVTLLPERLRMSGRWAAVGGLAGAVGCVAAATLVAPVAIASLPAWAGIGAAAMALLRSGGGGDDAGRGGADAGAGTAIGEAVSAAALFALVLELQGRDEAEISRVLDRVLVEENPPPMADAEAAAAWLNTLAARFDAVVAGEIRS
ncbi:MAG: DUF2868 domain-containing protein [Rhodospirillales bacterium]|nr:DUF2868 domain-containing protein [Rhodospirillales bacterium]